ncbi:hypothetical protein N9L05_04075, partial [Alphaproteobacteria bacterium]|nr:hypothetical protein [Alphaproteobacteria bacterium]
KKKLILYSLQPESASEFGLPPQSYFKYSSFKLPFIVPITIYYFPFTLGKRFLRLQINWTHAFTSVLSMLQKSIRVSTESFFASLVRRKLCEKFF